MAEETFKGYVELLRRFVELERDREQLEEELSEVAKHRRQVEGRLMKLMAEKGSGRESVEEGTVYLRRQIWASAAVSGEELARELVRLDMWPLVTCSPQRLSSWVREINQEPGDRGNTVEELRAALPDLIDRGAEQRGFERMLCVPSVPEGLSNLIRVSETFQLVLLRS